MRVHRTPLRQRRAGTTLTEVMMALLVTGIGLTSVMYLFPLSLQRALQANQITNATLLRINAAARLNASVGSLQIPGGGGTRGGNSFSRAIIEDPDNDGDVLEHEAEKFVFDPLGAVVQASDNPLLAGAFGWADSNNNQRFDGAGEVLPLLRYNYGFSPSTTPTAEEFVTLPDSFITLSDALGTAVSTASLPTLTFTGGADLTEYIGQSNIRVTFLDSSTPRSVLVVGATITGANTIDLSTGDWSALPVGFELGRVTVEIPERRYTWLATVRRIGTRPSVTVVVFFRLCFAAEDERVWTINEPAGGYNEFELPLAAGVDPPPGLKVGGWMFDMNAFRWLKIASIQNVTKSGVSGLRFTTDPEEEDPSPRARTGIPAMFPRGVVEAYTLKKE
jgi:Tfp pilus assembly protein PilV